MILSFNFMIIKKYEICALLLLWNRNNLNEGIQNMLEGECGGDGLGVAKERRQISSLRAKAIPLIFTFSLKVPVLVKKFRKL